MEEDSSNILLGSFTMGLVLKVTSRIRENTYGL